MRVSFLSLILLALLSCTSSNEVTQANTSPSELYRVKAVEKFREGIRYSFNASRTFVLCLKQAKPSRETPQQLVAFFIYDTAADSVVYESSIENGSVAWVSDTQVEVLRIPGAVTADDSLNRSLTSYRYDIVRRRTIPVGTTERHANE
ncbi:MAG: hypothetical protein WBD36_04505 [Bacteroidota bacterium]